MRSGLITHPIIRNLAFFVMCAALTHTSLAQNKTDADQQSSRSTGEQCLFIGHSFFCPVANSFNRIAKKSNFPNHEMQVYFRGGQAGTAGALWASPRARREIEEFLKTGKIQLFGLTPGLWDNAETFQRWFDLALKYNPKTRFFIGIPWAIGGQRMETEQFDNLIGSYAQKGAAVTEELRSQYPNHQIDFLAYGKMAPTLKKYFETGKLPDIDEMVGRGKNKLFSDNNLGHAGPMLTELCSLTWLRQLYGADLDSLNFRTYSSDVPMIIDEVMLYNAPFKAKEIIPENPEELKSPKETPKADPKEDT
mgnify:CR=1 FL=1